MRRMLLTGLMLACVATLAHAESSRDRYPASWWEPFPRDQAYDWEILPQDAGRGEVILSKRNELGILSNFADTSFRFRGRWYASMEGFWQAMKYPENDNDPRARFTDEWPHSRRDVERMVGFEAKDAGKFGSNVMRDMDINWVTYRGDRMTYRTLERGEHYDLIRAAMLAKLEQNEEVKDILLRTGDLVLRPDHQQGEDTPPAWKYYEIWMEIRSDLQASEKRSH